MRVARLNQDKPHPFIGEILMAGIRDWEGQYGYGTGTTPANSRRKRQKKVSPTLVILHLKGDRT